MEINAKNIKKQHPKGLIRYELLSQKGLGVGKQPNQRYFTLMNKYKGFFELYLKETLPLELIDQNTRESELGFKPIKEEDMDFYQRTSGMGLKYLYLRNNLYVEKLSASELQLLEGFTGYGDETKAFIAKTFLKVINPFDESRIVFYGPENQNFLCYSDEVVLGIRYDEFNTELEDEQFAQNFLEKQTIISQISTVMSIVGLETLGTNLRFIQYNELSIIEKY